MKQAKEFRSLTGAELTMRKQEFKKELLKLNVQVATGANPASPGKLKQLKKNIARINMVQREKEANPK